MNHPFIYGATCAVNARTVERESMDWAFAA
jgi:hypothetical protein